MPEAATKGKSRSAAKGEGGRSEPTLPALRVRYYRRMKPQRVYRFEVSWEPSDRAPRGEGKRVTLRLLAAGAQVLPAEQTLDATQPDEKAIFYVTPLAKGWLQNVKLEVLSGSRKIQEIPMASKVVSQRRTLMWFALSFIIPWLILTQLKYSPVLDEETVYAKYFVQGSAKYSGLVKLVEKNENMPRKVENFIKDNVPEVPELVTDNVPEVESGLKEARSAIAEAVAGLVYVSRTEPLAFYIWGVLILMTLVSAFFSRVTRKRARGKPIPLGPSRRDDDEDE